MLDSCMLHFRELVHFANHWKGCFILSLQVYRGFQADQTHNMISISQTLATYTISHCEHFDINPESVSMINFIDIIIFIPL